MKEPVKRKKLAREKTALKVARKWRKAPFSFIFLSFAGGELLTGATYFEKKNEKKRGETLALIYCLQSTQSAGQVF